MSYVRSRQGMGDVVYQNVAALPDCTQVVLGTPCMDYASNPPTPVFVTTPCSGAASGSPCVDLSTPSPGPTVVPAPQATAPATSLLANTILDPASWSGGSVGTGLFGSAKAIAVSGAIVVLGGMILFGKKRRRR